MSVGKLMLNEVDRGEDIQKVRCKGSDRLPTWMLKSPVSMNSLGVEAASDRSEETSSRNSEGKLHGNNF